MKSKWLPLAVIVGLACLALGLYIVSRSDPPPPNPDQLTKREDGSIRFPANKEGWYLIGTGHFVLEIKGTIDFGGKEATADTSQIASDPRCLVPDELVGVVVARIGREGRPFKVGSYRTFNSGDQPVYIAINDSYYKDNTGFYTIYVK